jgi:hypothetical protein
MLENLDDYFICAYMASVDLTSLIRGYSYQLDPYVPFTIVYRLSLDDVKMERHEGNNTLEVCILQAVNFINYNNKANSDKYNHNDDFIVVCIVLGALGSC